MGFIPEDQINRLKDSLDIIDVISSYIELKPAGASHKGLCPFHHEKTPSFMVNQQRNTYHCFGCGEGGDAISFIMKIENLDYLGAIRFLAEKQGMVLEETEYNKELSQTRERLYKVNGLAARFYLKNLLVEKIPQDYIKKRGLDIRVVNTFFLGYAKKGNGLYNFLLDQKVDVEDMIKLGLVAKSKTDSSYYDKFRDRLIFPILNSHEKVIGFGGRTLIDSNIKYLNSPESEVFYKGDNLYGITNLSKRVSRDKVILVEGYMDVIGLFNNGIDYACASLGTALTENQAKLVKRFGKTVYIAYDSDSAGIKATLRAIDIFAGIDVEPKIVEFPDSMDPDDFVLKYGVEDFNNLLRTAKKALDYKMDLEISKGGDKIALTERMINFLVDVDGSAKREIYGQKIANSLDISFEALMEDVAILVEEKNRKEVNSLRTRTFSKNNGYIKGQRDNKPVQAKIVSTDHMRLRLEKELISKSLISKDFYNILKEKSSEFILSEHLFNLYKLIDESYSDKDENRIKEIYKTEVYKASGLKQDDLRAEVSYLDGIEKSVCQELLKRVESFQLQEREESIKEMLKTDLSQGEQMSLIQELIEIRSKLAQ